MAKLSGAVGRSRRKEQALANAAELVKEADPAIGSGRSRA
jgi:hypothetical protein